MTTRRRTAVTLPVVLALAAALAACNANPSGAGAGSSGAARKGGTLTILSDSPTAELDPAKSQNLAVTTMGLFERRLTTWRIQKGKPAAVVPDLATNTGTPSDGGKTWTFHLKKGITFETGQAITSKDVKYGVERSFADSLQGGLSYHKGLLAGGTAYRGPFGGKHLASIATPDDRTVVFHLTTAYGDWPWIASMSPFAPVPVGQGDPQTYAKKPVASGPYRVESYRQGSALTLVRNPKWNRSTDPVRTAGPDRIVLRLGLSSDTIAQRLIADSGADRSAFGASFVPASQLAQIQRNTSARGRLVTSPPGALKYLAVNVKRPGLDDLKVRQALQYAVDRRSFLVTQGGNLGGSSATTLITPGIAGRAQYDLYPSGRNGDVAKAKQLLAAAGHAHDLKLSLLVQNDKVSLDEGQAVQQALQRTGIKVTLKPQEQTAFTQTATQGKGDYDLAVSSWQPDFPSANGNIQPLFDSSQSGNGGFNISRYENPAVDKLIAQATAATDQQQAQALWRRADRKVMGDAAVVPLIYTRNSFLHGSQVTGFDVTPFPGYPNYLTTSLTS